MVRTEKLQRIKVNKSQKKLGSIFYGGKTSFFRAKNLSVSTKTLWSVLCLLLLWPNNFLGAKEYDLPSRSTET